MTDVTASLDSRLDALHAGFLAKLPDRLDGISSLVDAVVGAATDDARRDALGKLVMAAHKLNGAAATFGSGELANAVSGLEQAANFLYVQSPPAGAADCEDLPLFVGALAEARQKDEAALADAPAPSTASNAPHRETAPASASRIVYIVEDDQVQARHLTAVLSNAGFEPVCLPHPDGLEARLANASPAAVIMDTLFDDGETTGAEAVTALRAKGLLNAPVIFISSRTDFETRLDAVRAGAVGYLVKPLDAAHVGSLLDSLTADVRREPFRALVVDDDEDLMAYYTAILESAGITVRGLVEPTGLLDVLTTFKPDVVVTDVNMPGCNGFELAGIVHQHPQFVHTPIIFITAEGHPMRRIMSLRFGGNDYLRKPVAPDILLSSVSARAERARLISSVTNLEKVRESEARFRQLADNIEEIFWMTDLDRQRFFYVSPAYDKVTGRPAAALYENPDAYLDAVHPDDRDAVLDARRNGAGRKLSQTFRIVTPDGSVRWVREKSFPVRDDDGEPMRIVGVTMDITEAREAEEARHASEESFRTVFAASPALIAISDPATGEHFDVNDAWHDILGYRRDEIVGKTTRELDLWADTGQRDAIVEAVNENGSVFNRVGTLRAKDGQLHHVLVSGQRILFGGAARFLWVAQDITERHRQEEELERRVAEATTRIEENARYMASVIDNTAEGIITIDSGGAIHTFNRAAENIFGYGADDVVGKDVSILLPPMERTAHRSYVQGSALYESRIINKARDLIGVRKNGEEFPLELNVAPMQVGGAKMFVGILHDITERKAAERAQLEAKRQAEEASRAKSEFLSSMSHELRTPLNAILGFSQLLQTDPSAPLTTSQDEAVSHILKSGEHLLELINEVLELARIEAGRLSVSLSDVEVAGLIAECLMLIDPRAAAGELTVVNNTAGAVLPVVKTDPTRLRQVLLNLLSNAVKYNQPGGTVTLDAETLSDGFFRIRVSDTGKGISKSQQGHIFEPFNRLGREEDVVEGTGIGLAITKKLVDALGCAIDFESAEGKGTTFWVDIPVSSAPAQPLAGPAAAGAAAEDPRNAAQGNRKTILYIEDHPANRLLVTQIVSRERDLEIVSAESAEEGLEMAARARPDLILMDINLPGMSGFEAMDIIRADADLKDVPVFALSANARPEDLKRGRAAGFRDYLTKPFDVRNTLAAIRAALREGDG